MVEPLSVAEARSRFREVTNREIEALTPETTWQWVLLSAVTGLVCGSLPEFSGGQTRRKLSPLMDLLDALERQIEEREKA